MVKANQNRIEAFTLSASFSASFRLQIAGGL
jgi:hypothetical protein